MRSYVNSDLTWNVTELGAGERMVVLNITNHRNYTERDVFPYAILLFGMNVTWEQTPAQLVNITTGETRGTITQWYVPTIGAGLSQRLNFTVSGTQNISALFTAGLSVNSVNRTVVLTP